MNHLLAFGDAFGPLSLAVAVFMLWREVRRLSKAVCSVQRGLRALAVLMETKQPKQAENKDGQ